MFKKHKNIWSNKAFLVSFIIGVLLLIISMFANYYANYYTSIHASNYVTDLFLDNLPVMDVHVIFSEGAVAFILALVAILLYEPKYLPFAVKSIAVFITIRSFFVILTHIAAPHDVILINPTDWIARISSGDDLFFSAHTGLPFLLVFTFWRERFLRYYFIFCTFVGGAAVLLGHLHYSIDVFSALFISFGIFHISKNLFKNDYSYLEYRYE